jgi:molybdopterin-guanine dinucleotide biosynthesis protein A
LQFSQDKSFSAAILAGGKNSRFNGAHKSFLIIDNHYIIDKIIAVLKNIFNEIIIVSNNAELYKSYPDIKIVNDFYKEIGPLGGIHAVLKTATNNNVFIVSCDMPFLNESLIKLQIKSHLAAESEITIPLHQGFKEPLHGIYNKEILKKLEHHIETTVSFKIRDVFKLFNVNYFQVPSIQEFSTAFTNINLPEDYQNIQKQFKK